MHASIEQSDIFEWNSTDLAIDTVLYHGGEEVADQDERIEHVDVFDQNHEIDHKGYQHRIHHSLVEVKYFEYPIHNDG